MSWTRKVPAAVPSDFQSSLPEPGAVASKKRAVPTATGAESIATPRSVYAPVFESR